MDFFEEADYQPSPNFNDRPAGTVVDTLVIHAISLPPGQFGGHAISDLFRNQLATGDHPFFETLVNTKVSAHLLINREGRMIQYVPFSQRAWHAGVSCFEGREECNDFSIGVELEGTDELPFEDVQYKQLAWVARSLMSVYTAITEERIVGHCDIAPGRKTDPGPHFNWERFRMLLRLQV